MKTAIIIHGTPEKKNYYAPNADSQSNCHWLPWLQQQLLVRDILAQTPEMPRPYDPVYADWKRELERYELDTDTILVGHSCGGGFLVRYLSENKQVSVNKVVLVAPWLDPDGELTTDMFDFDIDPTILERSKSITIFYSTDDDPDIAKSVQRIRKEVTGIGYKEFTNHGHFVLGSMGTREFPELLHELVG